MNSHQRRVARRARHRQVQRAGGIVDVRVVRGRRAIRHFERRLAEHHALGDTPPVGDFLRQEVWIDGEAVALLAWGPAALCIKDRDRWIGWTARLHRERLKLVVQNRRFCLLGEKGEHPNRASQVLAAAVRALPEQWAEAFGYRPALAESFTDAEAQAGTCYKAAGWEAVGKTAGYGRHRADYYVRHGRPKRLWLKELPGGGRAVLCAPHLPESMSAGVVSGHGALAVPAGQLRSLREALGTVPDPRSKSTHYRIGPVLSIVAMALLSGYRDLASFHRFGQSLDQRQRAHLGLPLKKRRGRFREVPGYKVYYQLLAKVDLSAFAEVLTAWLAARAGDLPGALAMDGKMVRDTIGVLSLVEHDTGLPVAMAPMRSKDDKHPASELKVAQRLIHQRGDLRGRVVSGDALHTQEGTAREIVERGGEYLLQIKKNQRNLLRLARNVAESHPPFLSSRGADTDGSRSAR